MIEIVDTATLVYKDSSLDFDSVKNNIQRYFKLNLSKEQDTKKIIFRNLSIAKYYYINFISLSELRKTINIAITFSYSRYGKKDNYELCNNEKTIEKVHIELSKLLKIITEKPVKTKDLIIGAVDISNQLEVPSISSYYKCKDIIYRALKLTETNGRLYFDTDDDRRKILDGLDFREHGKKRREANSYFKIYSKRKEEVQTGKNSEGHVTALRGELTLKNTYLKKYHLGYAEGINRENLENILFNYLAKDLATGIEEELNYSINYLSELLINNKTNKIREILTINEHHIFDVKILDTILTPEIIGVSERQCRTYKKQIKEILQEIENMGEIKQSFVGNFERLIKLVRKIAKTELKFEFQKRGVKVLWEKSQSKTK